jgi:hypothetical protein
MSAEHRSMHEAGGVHPYEADVCDADVSDADAHDTLAHRLPTTLPSAGYASFAEARVNTPVQAAEIIDRGGDPDCQAGGESACHAEPAVMLSRRRHWVQELTSMTTCTTARPERRVPEEDLPALLRRRASRLSQHGVDVSEVASLLEVACQTRSRAADAAGRTWTSRNTPSAGGTHSIELLAWTNHPTAQSPTTQWLRMSAQHKSPSDSAVVVDYVDVPSDAATVLLDAVRDVLPETPPACIFAVADTARLWSRYPNGTSLLWRDAGVITCVLHLLASEQRLGSTILGCGGQIVHDADGFPTALVGAVALSGTDGDGRREGP